MTSFARVYGLCLSSNIAIPGLRATDSSKSDCEVLFGSVPPHRPSQSIYESATLTVSDCGADTFVFQYDDGTRFLVGCSGTRIWADWPDPLTLDDAATYLLGPILGFVLRQRGVVCLHASAIRVGDKAVALAGGNGAGKSTLAAKFADLGYRVLTDDLLPLRQSGAHVLAESGYPRLRLWPEATREIYGSNRDLPALTPNWDKRYLDLGDRFQGEALPLAAIYLLGDRSSDAGVPRFEDPTASEAYWALVANSYSNYLLSRDSRAREFDALASILETVPVRTVIPSSCTGSVASLCEFLAASF